MKLVDAVIQLHELAVLVLEEIGDQALHNDIRNVADRLHLRSIQDDHVNNITTEIIKQAKDNE
jgi:hypothetical protein